MDLLPDRYSTVSTFPLDILTRAAHNVLHAFACDDMPTMDLCNLCCSRLQRNGSITKFVYKGVLAMPFFVRGTSTICGLLAARKAAFEGWEAAYYHGLRKISTL
jgi:hypothetical protein